MSIFFYSFFPPPLGLSSIFYIHSAWIHLIPLAILTSPPPDIIG